MATATSLTPLREIPSLSPYKKGDVLVLFGELFQRGYANGLVEEAEKQGMTIIRATVGRRDKDGQLRALNPEEIQQQQQPFINVPLEAGFDLELDSQGKSLVDYLKDVKLSDWQNFKLPPESLQEWHNKGTQRFRKHVQEFVTQLESMIPKGSHVLFAHLMAGGVPRAKVIMPLMNRAFKGTGERYLSSETFWTSSIGQICARSFQSVTAETLQHLLDLTANLRNKKQQEGCRVSYLGYGYHGTEVLHHGKYQWQTYTPYLQGWAKIDLEKIAVQAQLQGIHCTVYNCPEILTNSSSIFQGVEVCLYPLLSALKKESGHLQPVQKLLDQCQQLLKTDITFPDLLEPIQRYLDSDLIQQHCIFQQWPQHSSASQLEKMITTSEHLVSLHQNEKNLITHVLSEAVFKSCGYIMLHESFGSKRPVLWIGHDAVAKCMQIF